MAIKDIAINIKATGVERTAAGLKTVEASANSMGRAVSGVTSQVAGFVGGFSMAALIKESIDAALAVERIESAMKATHGSGRAVTRELEFIREEAQRLGLVYTDTALAYSKFSASTRNTSIEGEATRKIFSGVAEAVTALKLSGEESNGIFLALSQMMSKGKISAEELSGQLGERLPGAVKLTADAMGITTQELLKQMQAGKLMSVDVLPKLAEQLHKTYGAAATESAAQGQAGINRFKNEVNETAAAIGSKLLPALTELANSTARYLHNEREGHGPLSTISRYFENDVNRIKMLYGDYKTILGEIGQKSPLGMSGGADTEFWRGIAEQGRALNRGAREDLLGNYFLRQQQTSPNIDPQSARAEADRKSSQNSINSQRAASEKAAAASAAAEEQVKKAAKEADSQYQHYTSTLEGFNKQIRDNNPDLDQHEKALLDIDATVEKEIKYTPQYVESLHAAGEAWKTNLNLSKAYKDAMSVQDNMTGAWEGELKLRSERAQTAAQFEIQMNEQQGLRQEALRLQIKLENSALNEKGLYSGQVKELKDKVDAFKQANVAQQEATALAELQRQQAMDLSRLKNQNIVDAANLAAAKVSPGGYEGIKAHLEAEKVAIKAKYEMERQAIQNQIDLLSNAANSEMGIVDSVHRARMAAIEAENKAKYFNDPTLLQQAAAAQMEAEKGYNEKAATARVELAKHTTAMISALNTALTLSHAKEQQETLTAEQKAADAKRDLTMRQIGVVSDAMGQIGEVLMQGNREQFEAGKAMMMGQAVIAAALAIIQAYAQLGPIAGTIAAVGVGVATLAQISAIEATEYQPRALGGPVVAGGSYLVGEQGPELIRMGSAGTVIPNNALAQAGEAQLKATRENTKAIARLSEGFHEIAGSMKDVVLQATNNGLVTNRIAGVGVDKDEQTLLQKYTKSFFAPINGTLNIFKTNLIDTLKGATEHVVLWSTLGLAGNVFGGQRTVTGAGLQLGYAGGTVNTTQYTQIKRDGGMFHSDKTSVTYEALDASLNDSLNGIANSIAQSVSVAGTALGGLTADLSSVSLAATNLDLRGMSEDQANKAIEDWFGTLAVAMAAQLGGPEAQAQLESATRFGETSYEALMRITVALQAVNEAATTTGNQLISTAQDVAIANADLASAVIDSFGGLDKFTSAIDKYNKVVNSDEAYSALKVAAAHREIAAALAGQSVQIPHTIAEYKALVEATDMTSPLYQSLIGLADSFGTIGDAAKEAQDKILDTARDTLSRTMDITRGLLTKIRDLQTTDSILSPEDQYKAASDMFSSSAARALAGDQEAAAAIPDLVQKFLDASKSYNASGAGFQADYRIAMETMSKLVGATGTPTVTEAQLLLDNLDKLGTAITDSNMQLAATIGESITAGLALAGTNLAYGISVPLAPLQTMDDLRALLSGDQASPLTSFSGALGSGTAGTATENLSNIRSNTATMIDALNQMLLANDVAPIAGGTQTYTRTRDWAKEGLSAVDDYMATWGQKVTWLSPTEYGRAVIPEYAQYDVDGNGYITEADKKMLSGMAYSNFPLPQYASGGNYPGGAAIVGEYGPELIDSAPGHVFRADETLALFSAVKRGAGGADGESGLMAELRALRAEVRSLREEVAGHRGETVKYGEATVRVQQYGIKRMSEAGESQADSLKMIASKSRLADME